MIEIRNPIIGEEFSLAEIRARAMKESLSAVGRYDGQRVRSRFLSDYSQENTRVVVSGEETLGFYVLVETADSLNLKHLYIETSWQGKGIGGEVLKLVKIRSREIGKPVRLNALNGSRSNAFYLNSGFRFMTSDEIDNYYEWRDEFESRVFGGTSVFFSTTRLTPTVYNDLRKAVGWTTYKTEQIEEGLKNSLYLVQAFDGKTPVAMGRVIGDGKMVFYIQDVIVLPEYQRLGIGHEIMKRIMNFIDSRSVEHSIVGLMAAVGKERFYEKFGFAARPNEKMGCGMSIWINKECAS